MNANESIKNLFDSDNIIQAFTVQHHTVAECLESGQIHRQPWIKSAAFTTTPSDPTGQLHRRAYLWMASQFAKRKSRRLHSAPIWIGFSADRALACIKDCETVVLQVAIPASEVLLSQYYRSPTEKWERVLWGEPCCTHEFLQTCIHGSSLRSKRLSWETLFLLTGDPTDWQAIVDRLEPHWLICRKVAK